MVRAELDHNPYLLKTEVSFNGNPPRINCLVEKYVEEKLQTWVNKVPAIFYDEMNGYDFVLDFTGTKVDFDELQKAFARAGVKKDQVQIFHKQELGSRNDKVLAIAELLKWLSETPNKRFDFSQFRADYKELFEDAYSFVIIGEPFTDSQLFDDIEVSVENVNSAEELRKTDLRSTPILLYLDRKTVGSLQHNLLELLNREDISEEQLFFFISPALDIKMERVIRDLGVKNPLIVSGADDVKIHRYMELYPVTDFIHDAIIAFREKADSIGVILEEENKKSEILNKDIHLKIKGLEEIQNRLKAAFDRFNNKDNMELPDGFNLAKSNLLKSIDTWKIRKTKIKSLPEALALSAEFEAEIRQWYDRFQQEVSQLYSATCEDIRTICSNWYKQADYDTEYRINNIYPKVLPHNSLPDITSELMNIKEEQYVIPKEAFLEKLFKSSEADGISKPVLETTFYYDKWRSYASEAVTPIVDDTLRAVLPLLSEYFDQLAGSYSKHIEGLISEITGKKERVSSQLSEDERVLQIDNDWHTAFCDKIYSIERS